jgi:hypothetical protein
VISGHTLLLSEINSTTFIGAARWLVELRTRPVSQVAELLSTAPRYRDLTPTQYQVALDWLRAIDLVDASAVRDSAPVDHLLGIALEHYIRASEPAWLDEFDQLVPSAQELPIDLEEMTAIAGLRDITVFEIAARVARKFDDARQKQIGLLGEKLFIDWIGQRSSAKIDWVSQTDDTAGFDIEVRDAVHRAQVEVKATTSTSRVRFYLSRNEYKAMQRSFDWSLQIVVLDGDSIANLFTVDRGWLSLIAPTDPTLAGKWESMTVVVPQAHLREGPGSSLIPLLDLAEY